MKTSFVLTALGRDRPGIVAALTEMIFDLGCNLEDGSMMKLGSEFAILLLMSGPGEDLGERLEQRCKHLEQEKGMAVFVRRVTTGPAPAGAGRRTYRLRTLGEDKAGIVARTARAVADAGGTIAHLSSSLRRAASSGTAVYEMEMTFDLPAAADIEALRARLDAIENSLHIDVTLAPD